MHRRACFLEVRKVFAKFFDVPQEQREDYISGEFN